MSEKEHQELNCWIAENVFGWDVSGKEWCASATEWFATRKSPCGYPPDSYRYRDCALPHNVPKYTTDPAASDELEDAILQHPQGNHHVELVNGIYYFTSTVNPNIGCGHTDKKICRAIFARRLFTK